MTPLVRIVDASLGRDDRVRLVVSGVDDPDGLRAAWASSGATVELDDGRLHATTTVAALVRAAGRNLDRRHADGLRATVLSAVDAWLGGTPMVASFSRMLEFGPRPALMGIVNVTPDSFSDGGVLYPDGHPEQAIAAAQAMHDEGAELIDIGGESSRPGAEPVAVDHELSRTIPVVEGCVDRGMTVSIDTTKAEVAQAAIDAGAAIVNDVSGARYPELVDVVARSGAAYVLMHARATPADMQQHTRYDDVVAEIYEYLADTLDRLDTAGIPSSRVIVDPGIGFAKELGHNLAILRELRQFRGLSRPVLVGASRKSFIGTLTGADAGDRLEGSLAAAVIATLAGAAIIRVHDVAETRRALDVAAAVAHSSSA